MTENHHWLDEELVALAREDRGIAVPPAIRATVLDAWDRRGPSARGSRTRAALWVVPVAAAAGLTFVLLLTPGNVAEKEMPAHVPLISQPVPSVPPVAESPMIGVEPTADVRRRAPQLPLPALEGEFVLVPDPFADQTPMNVVRVRMSRLAFASLGVPIGNPEADGLVEVEMVVGDDGLARTIRRATFVSDSMEGGVQR